MKDMIHKLPNVQMRPAIVLLVLSICVLIIAIGMKPVTNYATYASDLENNIPTEFGDWKTVPQQVQQVSLVSDNNVQNQIYDDVLMRTYVNKEGAKVMLALAYAKEQRQDVKVHQPDICYPAQGFQLLKSQLATFRIAANESSIIGKNQLYASSSHLEAVSYWIRVGDGTFLSGLQMRLKIIKDGLLKQRFDDGMLVRVSSVTQSDVGSESLFKLHEKFLNDLIESVRGNSRKLLVPVAI
ncbi:MAG TPA: EpsI family protein [Methylophilus sp.]|uniref:exosortase C-terminal domain/associated protein EpsI n=1 Tax=Methylophilus sp. TaxID=29541 RepID=UPI002CE8EB60|nr:exosortase C-terminal domain/associated protein EpsI [Methylophilus sp.]HSH88030.1 EpsI family protein [Methylophilus sp.]